MKKNYKITEVAKDLGISRATLYNWKNQGILSFQKSESGGLNFINETDYQKLLNLPKSEIEEKVIIYCRVSSTVNKNNLQTQKERLVNYCNAKGYKVEKVVEEFGSGINDKRPKLQELLEKQNYTKLVVEHKDRLSRLGFNYIEVLLKQQGITIEVINNVDTDEEDIIQDFVSIITSYCARIYGKRRSKRKTEKIIEELKKDE
jgi:predicted site-specific integrase-resolvase